MHSQTANATTARQQPAVPWASEPFRVLFPIGCVLGLIGVALWPLHFSWPDQWGYPLQTHRHIMMQGYLAAFAMGFLGTAGPRLLSAPPLKAKDTITLACLILLPTLFHLLHLPVIAHLAFVLCVGFATVLVGVRFKHRQDLPPPGFPLIVMTWSSGFIGSLFFAGLAAGWLPYSFYPYATLLLDKLFPLGMILAVSAFLLPRFWGAKSAHWFEDMLKPSPRWNKECAYCLALTAALLVGGLGTVAGLGFPFNFIIPLSCTLFILLRILALPAAVAGSKCNALGWMARISLVGLIVGLWLEPLVSPAQRIATAHIFFLSAISLLILAVGTRVIWGHSGQLRLLVRSRNYVLPMLVLMAGALIARFIADSLFSIRSDLLIAAVLLWAGAHFFWAITVLPGVLIPDNDH